MLYVRSLAGKAGGTGKIGIRSGQVLVENRYSCRQASLEKAAAARTTRRTVFELTGVAVSEMVSGKGKAPRCILPFIRQGAGYDASPCIQEGRHGGYDASSHASGKGKGGYEVSEKAKSLKQLF
jgi:hypothetical protein